MEGEAEFSFLHIILCLLFITVLLASIYCCLEIFGSMDLYTDMFSKLYWHSELIFASSWQVCNNGGFNLFHLLLNFLHVKWSILIRRSDCW